MRYFINTEYNEYKKKVLFGKPVDTIDMISIGIVSEDDREYYAISKDFDLKAAWDLLSLRENVLKPIHYELASKEVSTPSYDIWTEIITARENGIYSNRHYKTFKRLINKYGKTKKQIAKEIKEFVYKSMQGSAVGTLLGVDDKVKNKPEFYGFYSGFDWVVFSQLFDELPIGFPKYCIDLKQELDNYVDEYIPEGSNFETRLLKVMYLPLTNRKSVQNDPQYPKQTKTCNALLIAKWNKKLYEFLNTL